jgi:hypothetical protein
LAVEDIRTFERGIRKIMIPLSCPKCESCDLFLDMDPNKNRFIMIVVREDSNPMKQVNFEICKNQCLNCGFDFYADLAQVNTFKEEYL